MTLASAWRHTWSIGVVTGLSIMTLGTPALADPVQQLARAMAEVRAAQSSSDIDVIQQHFRYAQNCIVGRDSGYYFAPGGDAGPCTDRRSVRDQTSDPLNVQRLRNLENTLGSARMQRNVVGAHDAAEDAAGLIGQIQHSAGGGSTAMSPSARSAVQPHAATNAQDAAYTQMIANARAAAMARAAAARQAATSSHGISSTSRMSAAAPVGSPMDATFRRLLIAKYGGDAQDRKGVEIATVQIGAPIHAGARDAREWEVNLNQTVYPVHTRYSLVSRSGVASSIRDWDTHYVMFVSPITHQWDISSAVQAKDIDGVLRGAGPAG